MRDGEPVIDPETKLAKRIEPRDSATVFVDVTAYNSKNYYMEGDVLVTGRMPITGNETVLDAIHFAGGLMPTAARRTSVWCGRLLRAPVASRCCRSIWRRSPAGAIRPPTISSCRATASSSTETRS